jgi:amino acid transporter
MLSVFVIALLTCLRQEQQSPEVFAIVLTGLFGFVLLFYHTWIVEMRAYGDLAPYFFVAYCLIPIDSKGDRIDS